MEYHASPMKKLTSLLLGIVLCGAHSATAQWLRVVHDGFTSDWEGWPVLATDAAGDASPDLQILQASRDESTLTLRLRLGADLLLQESNALKLALDTDWNSSTGTAAEGLGAELIWTFGSRSGSYKYGSTTAITVRHDDLGLRTLPTHSSSDYEITFNLAARPDGSHLLFPLDSLKAVVYQTGGDRLPSTGFSTVRVGAGSLPALAVRSPQRVDDGSLRIAAWNVLSSGLFNTTYTNQYDRLLTLLAPDIISFEEVWNESAAQTVTRLNQLVPELGPWTAVKLDPGNVIASRFPIRNSWLVQGTYRETAALIDASSVLGDSLLFIACHLRCCTANAERQDEADGLIQFLKDARTGGGAITLPEGTPMLMAGDFNLVGDRQQLVTLLTGDIVDNATYGVDSPPDWDGGALADLVPLLPTLPDASTWWDNGSTYLPGRLDLMLYTDSALENVRSGILGTSFLGSTELAAWGVLATDSWDASDHYPVWGDFRLPVQSVEAPGLGIVRQGDGSLLLSWNAVPGATLYRVERAPATGEAWSVEGSLAGTSLALPMPTGAQQSLYRVVAIR